MKNYLIILTVIFFGTADIAFAELFKWKDDEGTPHMTDRLDKVPKKFRDTVIIEEAGKPSNISQNHKKKYSDPNVITPSSASKPYDGKSLREWLALIEEMRLSIQRDRDSIESQKLVTESFEASMDYSKDLNAQFRDLKERLADAKAREIDGDYTAAQKKKKIIYLTKQIKRVRARKNANLVKDEKKDAQIGRAHV